MCYNPIKIGYDKANQPIYASCRHCDECKQTRANEWAVRCAFELKDYNKSAFITLTYENNPLILDKEDLQKFMKRLRKRISPIKIKFFAAGEYGDKSLRPHFHIIIFGYDFPDRKHIGKSNSGYDLWSSQELEKVWPFGLSTVQEVTPQSIKYCALYASKTKRKGLPPWLWDYPEFNLMSKGLGVNNIINNIDKYLKTDEIYLEGFAHQIPKLVLEKVIYRNREKYENLIQTTKNKRKTNKKWYKDRMQELDEEHHRKKENSEKARLASKKKLHSKQKEL